MTSCLRAATCNHTFYKPDIHRFDGEIEVAVPLKILHIPKSEEQFFFFFSGECTALKGDDRYFIYKMINI